MAGSEADKQPDEAADSSQRTERPSLADFLKPPPSSKSSMPPPPETATVADVPPTSSTRGLSDLFSEAPVPRSRRRSSLIPQQPSTASAAPVDADEERNAEESSHADDILGAAAALSVPPPLFSSGVARRVAIAAGTVLIAVAFWTGARKLRTRLGHAASGSASALAPSAEVPHPLSPPDDLDPELPDDTAEELPVDEAKGLALRREARAMLEASRIDEGVATARRAIEANPADPENYILLAAGLQDQGKWDEARQIFGKCARQSTRAERSECVYFATRGK